ncbi:MAG: hypothetical protein ABIF28_04400 [Pseudomonadota bacterium]
MKYTDNFGGASKVGLGVALSLVRSFPVADLDVLSLRLANTGASAVTGFELRASVANGAPADVLPVTSWVVDDGLTVFRPASVALTTLAAGVSTRLGVNVSDSAELQVWASGVDAVLEVSAGGYEVAS